MNDKINRIAEFMQSLPVVSGEDCYSEIIGQDQLDLLAAGVEANVGCNSGDCINSLADSCNLNGGNCKNYAGVCSKSDNGGACYSTSLQRPTPGNGALCD